MIATNNRLLGRSSIIPKKRSHPIIPKSELLAAALTLSPSHTPKKQFSVVKPAGKNSDFIF
jgi:hypothetical protein